MTAMLVIGGIALLWIGGELLIRGSVRLAATLGVRPLIIGLTVVAFGTSSPELAASLVAALANTHDMVLGNVVGSNILNIALILGLTGLLYPLATNGSLLRREIPVMLGAGLLLFGILANGAIGRWEGGVLFGLLCIYLVVLYRDRREGDRPEELAVPVPLRSGRPGLAVLQVIVGIVTLTLGARWLVNGAREVALAWGITDRIIGLTIVAFGTSLPELVSALIAALRQEADLVLGNLVGSSIFNVLAILGLTALVRPIAVDPGPVILDLALMTGIGAVAWLLLATRRRMERWEGGVLLALFALYVMYLFVVK